MTSLSETAHDGDLSEFERQVAEAEAALEAMPAPAPRSSRQVIIATRESINRKSKIHGVEAVWKAYVALGHNVKLSTFRDYVYNGAASREARGADAVRKTRRSQKGRTVAAPEQPIATESTARGAPVRARKMT